MSTQVDDLKIKLEADAKGAESEIDKLITKIGNLESKVSSFGKGGGSLFKAVKSVDFSGVKNKIEKMRAYTESVAKQMAKNLTLEFDVKNDSAKQQILNLTQKIVEEQVKASKSIAETGKGSLDTVNAYTEKLAKIVTENHNVKDSLAEVKNEWEEFYNILLKTNKVNIGDAGLKELQSALGKWQNMDGLITQKFSSKKGISLDTLFGDWDTQLKGQLSSLGATIGKDAQNDKDRILIVVEALKRFREEAERIPKASDDDIYNGVWERMIGDLHQVDKTAKNTFKTFETGVAELRREFGDLGKDFAERGGFSNLTTPDSITKAIENAKSARAQALESAEISGVDTKGFETSIKKAITLENHIEILKQMLENLNTTEGTQSATPIDALTEKVKNLKEQLAEALAADPNFKSTEEFKALTEQIKEAEAELGRLNSELEQPAKKTSAISWSDIGRAAKESFDIVGNAVQKVTALIGGLASAIGSRITNGFRNMTRSVSKFDLTSKGLAKSLLKVSNMLKLMITRMALRAVIAEVKKSFTELIQFSDKCAESYNKIRNAIKYLADSLAALTAPILKSSEEWAGLGNIMDFVADKIVDITNQVNQLTSALLGHSTWIKATKQTKDYASEIDKAGKKAKHALQPFDELNNITTNKDNGDSGTFGKQFREIPIDDKWKNIASWLKSMWQKADFTGLGALLGRKLRDALNRIPWEMIKKTAKKIGKSLATLLNGFFETPNLAKSIGKTIAEAINTALEFALEFVKNFHFDSFGTFVGELISSALSNIEWTKLNLFAKKLGRGIADAINALLKTDAIQQIGNALGNVLRTAIDFAFELITNIDFDKLGEDIVQGLKNFFARMNDVDETGLNGWQKLGKTISDGLLGILGTINTILGNEELMSNVSTAITDFFDSIDFVKIIGESEKLIGNIVNALLTVIKAAFASENFRAGVLKLAPLLTVAFGAVFTTKLLAFGARNVATGFFTELGKSFAAGTGSQAATTAILTKLQGIGTTISSNISTFMAGTGGAILTACGTIAASVATFFEGAEIGKLVGYTLFPDDAEMYENYMGIKGTLELLKDTFVAVYDDVGIKVDSFMKHLDEACGKSEGIAGALLAPFVAFKDFMKDEFPKVYNFFVAPFERIKKFFEGFKAEPKEWGANLGKNILEGLDDTLVGRIAIDIGTKVGKSIVKSNASGGILIGNKWKPIQGYAMGGTPKTAEMFMARENGVPEMVGRIGNNTAVANNDQIVASVSDGVYRAVIAAMNATNNNSGTNVNIELVGDTSKLFKAIRKEGNDYQRRTGNPVWA